MAGPPIGLLAAAPILGRDCAVASTLFHRATLPGKVGRQMQTWVKFPEGWRVVAAHVSLIEKN